MSLSQVYFIHGYGSSIQSSDTFKKILREIPTAIGLTYRDDQPAESIAAMSAAIHHTAGQKDVIIVGSSLGGWYAEMISRNLVCDVILYNPCINPSKTLARHASIPNEVLDKYWRISFDAGSPPASTPRNIILCVDDEIIYPGFTEDLYRDVANIIPASGGHRMTDENLRIVLDRITYIETLY